MTHRGPFQPLLFCDSVNCWSHGDSVRKEGSRDSCHSMAVTSHSCRLSLWGLRPPPWIHGCYHDVPGEGMGACSSLLPHSPGDTLTCCLAFLVSLGKLICSPLFGSVANIITLTDKLGTACAAAVPQTGEVNIAIHLPRATRLVDCNL